MTSSDMLARRCTSSSTDEIIPVATEFEHSGRVPDRRSSTSLKEMGVFGLMIPEEYGGLGESLLTYALVCRGDRARLDERVSGVINTHFIVAYMLHAARHRGAEGRTTCRAWPTGEVRGGVQR
jgi:alkylation response protein AidB-like acyl-CoA dehydrogenase